MADQKQLEKYILLIPDYLKGGLSGQLLDEFESALEQNPELQAELQEARVLKESLKSLEQDISVPSEQIFQSIANNISIEQDREATSQGATDWIAYIRERLHAFFHAPGLAWGMCAVQALLLIWVLSIHQPATFQTLSASGSHRPGGPAYVVVFKSNADFGQVTRFMQQNHVKIVDGPSKKGMFRIIIEGKDAAKDAEALEESGYVDFIAPSY